MGHDHGHASGPATGDRRRRLAVVLGLTLAVLAAEVVAALVSGSLALLADAGHMATDAVGIALALTAVTLAQRPARGRRTFGWQRAEILAAVANGLLLLGVAGYVLVEAVRQLMGEAGRRQVKDARNALVTGIGVIPYGRNWGTSSALVLAN